jgi:enoyl-CoA hydratase/carnithine racemase
VLDMLLSGKPVRAAQAQGWLVDVAAPLEEALAAAWSLARGEDGTRRRVVEEPLTDVAAALPGGAERGDAGDVGRQAIWDTVLAATGVSLAAALEVQSRHSAAFMTGKACRAGVVGTARARLEG